MASLEDLKDAIKETLDNRGVVDQLRAKIRAEIFNALDDKESPKPHLTNENLIINELIREYLEFNQYKHTLSVFLPETGQPKEPLQRKFLAKETNLVDDSTTLAVPLLYSILAKLQEPSAPTSSQSLPNEYAQDHEFDNPNFKNKFANNVNSNQSKKGLPPKSKVQQQYQPQQQYQQQYQPQQQQQHFGNEANVHPLYSEDDLQPLVFTHK